MHDGDHVAFSQVDLLCYLGGIVPAGLQATDFPKKLDRRMIATRDILHQTHQETLFPWRIDHDCWDFRLAEFDVGFEAALAADQIVGLTISWLWPPGYSDWLLEAQG